MSSRLVYYGKCQTKRPTRGGTPFAPGANGEVTVGENDVVVCTFTNTRQQGSIELVKAWSGTGGQTTLKIGTTVGGSEVDSQLIGANGGAPLTTGANAVDTGTYYVSESGGLSTYNTSLACTRGGTPFAPGANGQVSVGRNDVVVCTFTNTRQQGKIEVVKDLVPSDSSGRFSLLIDGAVYATDVGNGGSTGEQSVDTGSHSIAETPAAGTNPADYITSVACVDTANGNAPVTVTAGNLNVGYAQDIVCTFTNRLVSIAINKQIGLDAAGPWQDSLLGVAVETLLYYRFVVANNGGVDLENVTVTDATLGAQLFGDPAHIFCTIQGISAGASEICGPFGPTVSQHTGPGTAYPDGFVNTATASGCYLPATYADQYCRSSDDSASYSEGSMSRIGYLPLVMR